MVGWRTVIRSVGCQRCHLDARKNVTTYNDSQHAGRDDIPRAGKQACQTQIPKAAGIMSVPIRTTQSRQVRCRLGK